MSRNPSHLIIAYYHLAAIADPHGEVARHKAFFQGRDVASRIYISEEGINCQMSALKPAGEEYMRWLEGRPEFSGILFKIDPYGEHVFPKVTVKYRRQLVAFDARPDMADRGEHVAPAEWKEMLEREDGHLLLDIRNDYEWDVGRFASAECPPCRTSAEFKRYAEHLKERIDRKNTPVMMYCTGGIRCEFFSAMLKEEGFEKVYQLEGGVINYGKQQGSDRWVGKLFVFDDRLTVPVGDKETPVVGSCRHCAAACDSYYNCANTDCNELFLCCPDCVPRLSGCCCSGCTEAERLRPYREQGAHKPFRKIKKEARRRP